MLKELVFNYDDSFYAGTLPDMSLAAARHGFSFFLFNGRIYRTGENGCCELTGLYASDIVWEVVS